MFDAEGDWRGLSTHFKPVPTTPPPPAWFESESLRVGVKQFGTWAWVPLLVWTGMTENRQRARRLAQFLLATSILILLAVVTAPSPLPRRASDDQLLWLIFAPLMVAASA